MDVIPATAALAVILIAAGLIVRSVPSEHTTRVRPGTTQTEPDADPVRDDPWGAAEPSDPWLVEQESLTVGAGDVIPGSGRRPVLAYIELPRRSPDPERLIQTEILVPVGTAAGAWRAARLIFIVLAFGVIVGAGAVGAARLVVVVFSAG